MNRRPWLALLAAFGLLSCRTQHNDWPAPSPALWQVTGPHGETGWLFGTIHALPKGARWETPALDRTLDRAGLLVVEIANLSNSAAQAQAFAAVSRSAGLPPLLSRVAPSARPALAKALERGGLQEHDFASVESWAAALIIANAGHAGEAENGVDRALLGRRLPTVGLEGFAEQFALFDRMPEREQDDLLRLSAEDDDPREERRLTLAWIKGDLAALDREADDGILADPELRRTLLIDRNRAWVDRIVPLLQQGRRPFVAVGADHMLGDVGLPAQLQHRGFTVRRIQ